MLIVLLGAGNGIIHAFEQNASERALNSIRIFPGWTTKSYDGLKEGRRVQLDNRDMDDTEKQFTENVISAGATVRQSNVNVSFGQEYINISLLGVYPNYTEVETVKTADGRFIHYNDLERPTVKSSSSIRNLQISFSEKRILNPSDNLSMPVEWPIK